MADYAKMKNADLEALLKERGLPHTGKKADMVKRLQDADVAPSSAPAAAKKDEDEIDWDDEPASAPAPAAAAAPPSSKPAPSPAAAPAAPATTSDAPAAAAAPEPAAPAAPAKDFTAGLAPTGVDEEIARRRARAAKFGINPDNDETLKALERAKKFGTSESSEGGVAGRLDAALPEKRERKRGREQQLSAPGGGEEARKRSKGAPRTDGKGATAAAAAGAKAVPEKRKDGAPSWMTDADRAKAEARKAKFATAT